MQPELYHVFDLDCTIFRTGLLDRLPERTPRKRPALQFVGEIGATHLVDWAAARKADSQVEPELPECPRGH